MKNEKQGETKRISDENLTILIDGLQEYKDKGVVDPWVLSDGSIVEPLDVLKELREAREKAWKYDELCK